MASTQQMTESMKQCTRAMQVMNRQMNMPQLQKIMMEFAKQAEMLDMKQEMFGDAIEDAMEEEDNEEQEDEIINQVLDEIGISFSESMVDAPTKKEEKKVEVEKKDADTLLKNRFKNL